MPNHTSNSRWNRQRRNRRRRNCSQGPVGTEAIALENMKQNAKTFSYPSNGFVTPIEYSLLYSMLSEPKLYPDNVVLAQVQDEDFDQYLHVKTTSKQEEEQDITSYAQLSAILNLSAQHWPPEKKDGEEKSVPQTLCKCLLNCVVRYARENDLDREQEVNSLLLPLQQMAQRVGNHACLAYVLPLYVGMAASVVTANPLPLVVGSYVTNAVGFGAIYKMRGEEQKVRHLQVETNRMADVEKASLLDEAEEW